MRVILIPVGSAGDVYPFTGLGEVLAQRGHHITILTNPKFADVVERRGFDFVPLGTAEEFDRLAANPDLWDGAQAFKLIARWAIVGTMEPIYEALAQLHVPGETIVAAQVTAFGARVASEKLGFPLVSVHLQPSVFRSVYETPHLPPMLSGPRTPRWLKRLQYYLADKLVVDPMMVRELNDFRRRLGLESITRPLAGWWYARHLNLGLFPEWFAPPQPDWPANTTLTGFPLWDPDNDAALAEPVAQFLERGSPPIVWTPGSAVQHAREFFEAAIEACERLDRRGILLTRHTEQLPENLPDRVAHFDYVPLRTLMPLAAALVHHGGVGTMSQGLAAGRPQLIMPMAHDQPDNAARVTRLGVGASVAPKRFTGSRVAEVLDDLLNDREVAAACARVSARIDDVDALRLAADAVESLQGARVGA